MMVDYLKLMAKKRPADQRAYVPELSADVRAELGECP